MAIILAVSVVKSSRVDSFKDTSFICGGGLLGLQEFKPQLYTMTIYPNPVGIMNYHLWTFQIQSLNLLSPSYNFLQIWQTVGRSENPQGSVVMW